MQINSENPFLGHLSLSSENKLKSANELASQWLGLLQNQINGLYFSDLFEIQTGQEHFSIRSGVFKANSRFDSKLTYTFYMQGEDLLFYPHSDTDAPSKGANEQSLSQTLNALELDDKVYQLELIGNLLKKLSDVIELKEILRNYAEFICQQLFIQAASVYCLSEQNKIYFEDFVEFDNTLDFKNQRQKMHVVMRNDTYESFESFEYIDEKDLPSSLRTAYAQSSAAISGLLQVPIISKGLFLGSLHFLIYEPRMKISEKEIALIKMTLQQIRPFIDNSINYRMAMTDELTKTYNKRMFNLYLDKYFSLFKQERLNNLCLLVFDIDHFKKINDTYGHSGGDIVLHDFARVLSQSVRAGDSIFRIGGEEFAIILKEPKDISLMVAERIFKNLAAKKFMVGHEKFISVTTSCGLSQALKTDPDYAELFDRSDLLLYKSKHDGRNRISL